MNDKQLLLIPKISVQNANALSSPFTIGFPAMTAWLGFTHALQRKLNQQGLDDLIFKSVAVISHSFDLKTYKGPDDFVHSIVGTGNPLDKDGNRSAFIEEARANLTVSLLIEYEGNEEELDEEDTFIPLLINTLHKLKLAGGDILTFSTPEVWLVDEQDDHAKRKCLNALMPGYVLIERRDLMQYGMENGADAIDVVLDYLAIHHTCEQTEDGDIHWQSQRATAGWVVPVATGFHGISELNQAKNQRDPDTPHRFAESIVTLGEFVMPYRIQTLDDMLWHYHFKPETNLYLCQPNTAR